MACLNPKIAWCSTECSPRTGRRIPTFNRRNAFLDLPKMELPCLTCLYCSAVQQRMWAIRMYHEAQMHKQSAFVTWTYNEQSVPHGLVYEDFQSMLKRLRKSIAPEKLRFLVVGELGERTRRPHFHAALYGMDFSTGAKHRGEVLDALQDHGRNSGDVWEHPILDKSWKMGGVRVGTLAMESCMYMAGYCLKKSGAKPGEFLRRQSNRPGIGHTWLDAYYDDIVRTGFIAFGKQRLPVPKRYFDWYVEQLEPLVEQRHEFASEQARIPKAVRDRRNNAKCNNLKARMALKGAGSHL